MVLFVLIIASCFLMEHSPTYAGEWQGFQTVTFESLPGEKQETIYTTVWEYQLTEFLMADFVVEKKNEGIVIDLSGTIYFIDLFGNNFKYFGNNTSILNTNRIFTTAGIRYLFYNKDPIEPTYYISMTYRF
jgi:hypothetical protein